MGAADIPSVLPDVTAAVVNGNYALDYGIDPSTAIFEEKDYVEVIEKMPILLHRCIVSVRWGETKISSCVQEIGQEVHEGVKDLLFTDRECRQVLQWWICR